VIAGRPVIVGGTSVAAPLWAGLIARINQGLGKRAGYFNPILYRRIGPAGFFREIVSGNNAVRGVPGYQAGPGWNACAGWGTPDGSHLLSAFRLLLDSRTK
jgi:kumamolisin